MSDFPQVVKYLDIVPSSKDTTVTDKYPGIHKTRAIKKIQTIVVLPTTLLPILGTEVTPRMMFQFNVTAPFKFRILELGPRQLGYTLDNLVRGGVLTVKWRVGTTVYRYAIVGKQYEHVHHIPLTPFEPYAGQLIQKNCVFEFWLIDTFAIDTYGTVFDIQIFTSLYRNPTTPDEIEVTQSANPALGLNVLGIAIPETIPTVQPDIAWLDNP